MTGRDKLLIVAIIKGNCIDKSRIVNPIRQKTKESARVADLYGNWILLTG
jgi:hypothetical protein